VLAAREGAAVACADVDAESVRETAAWVGREGQRGVVLIGDVADAADCSRLVTEAREQLGGLDGLVCQRRYRGRCRARRHQRRDVGPHLRHQPALALPAEPRRAAASARRRLGRPYFFGRRSRAGSLIPAYDASKAGLFGLARHVALEGAAGNVRAKRVVPGLIDTPLGRWATRGRPSRSRTPVPLGRQGTGWEIAYATVFLLSHEAA